ncbi:sigma-B regulation protein RsbU (phosphoserine phosphatase) [Pedobacter cryoconitis]|uniref:PAS domain-containing sensor histidine kinase n=1 Tax=Pedobacter cryoconitis TaxID=188932 RepID=UPI00160F827C|nr:PAS domain-containing sensor histidine kinase [Pedobacter cryoconitis]MBB6273818.1 sigma-B regulation protein RsbU (phosphoserine phosphatase) [Pedobacter cryoconitis]
MSSDPKEPNNSGLENNFEDFLEHSLSGYISTNPRGEIIRVNSKLLEWLGYSKEDLIGKRMTGLLAMGSRIFYETHLSPLLKLHGSFEEVAAELLLKDGSKLHILLNGYIRNDENNKPLFIRLNVYKATERKVYEENLRHAVIDAEKTLLKEREMATLREQFIAVLGHDLRNPLGAIKSGASLLTRSASSDRDKSIVGMIKKSGLRMEELIANVMDFARVRLGGGLSLDLKDVFIEPIILHVIEELSITFPERIVTVDFEVKETINCDADRISQLLSNLVANALTHGSPDEPVKVIARIVLNYFELIVSNGGKPIPEDALETLFEPFTREASSPSQQGLGLGLYIASQIANAHGGNLAVTSNTTGTSFIFRMPVYIID